MSCSNQNCRPACFHGHRCPNRLDTHTHVLTSTYSNARTHARTCICGHIQTGTAAAAGGPTTPLAAHALLANLQSAPPALESSSPQSPPMAPPGNAAPWRCSAPPAKTALRPGLTPPGPPSCGGAASATYWLWSARAGGSSRSACSASRGRAMQSTLSVLRAGEDAAVVAATYAGGRGRGTSNATQAGGCGWRLAMQLSGSLFEHHWMQRLLAASLNGHTGAHWL